MKPRAWRTHMPGASTSGLLATNPLVAGDAVYVQDLRSNVAALDLATGAVRWRRDAELVVVGPNGPALGYGAVYAVAGRTGVVALDAETGTERWSVTLPGTDTEGIDIQPVVHDRRLLLSTVPISLFGQFSGGDRGTLYALDTGTGDTVWTFDTGASPDLWGNPALNSGGGAWFPPVVDPDTDTVFWGMGNPAPFPGTADVPNGTSRPGPNLYTNSVVYAASTAGPRWPATRSSSRWA